MKNIMIAALVWLALPSALQAATPAYFYTRHCSSNGEPNKIAIGATSGGTLLWNARPTDWKSFQAYLAGIPHVLGANGEVYIAVERPNLPHALEINAILAREGITIQPNCNVPQAWTSFNR